MFTDALITAATVFVLMMLCLLLGAPPIGAVLIGLSFGLGSYAYPHALTLFTEPGTALCVVAAVYFAIRASRTAATVDLVRVRRVRGAALLFRVSAALFVPLIGLWLLVVAWRSRERGRRRLGPSSLRRVVRVRRVVHCGRDRSAAADARREPVALRQCHELRLRARARRPISRIRSCAVS